MKKISIIGGIALGLGILCLLLTYLITGGRFLANSTGESIPRQATFTQAEVQHLEVMSDVTDVHIEGADVEEVTVDYLETDRTKYQVVAENGTLLVKNKTRNKWMFGLDFDFFFGNEEDKEVRITLPRELLTSLRAELDVGDLTISNLAVKQDGHLKSDVGDTDLENLVVGGKLTIEQDVGDLEFTDLLVGQSLIIDTNVGDVSGTIADEMGNYTITSSIDVGDSNLPDNLDGGPKILDVTGDVGDVSIEFKP